MQQVSGSTPKYVPVNERTCQIQVQDSSLEPV